MDARRNSFSLKTCFFNSELREGGFARVNSVVGQFPVMFGKISKSRLFFLVAVVIGGIGAAGQAYLLYHELVNCLPYKVIGSGLYQSIANVGVWVAPLVAIIGGLLFGLKKFWLAAIVPVFSCPLLFAGVFKAASIVRVWSIGVETVGDFGDFTPAVAAQGFYSYTVSLVIVGLVVGAICSFMLSWLSKKERKLA